jgi:hypothetical protein
MGGCLIVLIGMISPRLAIIVLWLFTDILGRAYEEFWIPLIGFFLLPITTLVYALVYDPIEGINSFGWLLVIIAVALDLGAYGGSSRRRRK